MKNENFKNNTSYREDPDYYLLQELANGFKKSQIFLTALKYDVFSLLVGLKQTAVELAEIINVNSNALERLLDALVSMKFLNKNGAFYENAPIANKYLIHTNSNYRDFLLHNYNLWDSWGTLYEAINSGQYAATVPLHKKDKNFISNFIFACGYTKVDMIAVFEEIIGAKNIKKILKYGAIVNKYILQIAKANPDIDVYFIDYPEIIDVVESIAKNKYDLQNINYLRCDLSTNDENSMGNNYDIIFIDSIIEEYSITDNISALKNIYNALAKGGKLIIHQSLINNTRTEPQLSALQSINLLLNTSNGNTYTRSDIFVVLKEAGFGKIEINGTSAETHIIIATKSIIG